MYDAVIIGAGTAGMTAGIYLARQGKRAIILEGNTYGGQIVNSLGVENYPGIKNISGFDFATALYEQVLELGGEIDYGEVVGIKVNDNSKTVLTADKEYECERVIIATGAANRNLGVDGEEDLVGLGVSYCATCDGAFFRDRTVAVIGGGNTAVEDALFLAKICKKVYLVHRRAELRADRILQEHVLSCPNVEILWDCVPAEITGGEQVTGLAIRNVRRGEERELSVDGVFVAVGILPNTELLHGLAKLDENGYVRAGEDCATSAQGIFAAGDIRTKALRQVVTAAADGANAITAVQRYLRGER